MSTEHKDSKPAEISPPKSEHLLYESSELFQGENELIITHGQEHYRLRITRHDKLILTK